MLGEGGPVAMQGFGNLLYSVLELLVQRPGDENCDWLVQCKQCKHGLISKNYHARAMFNARITVSYGPNEQPGGFGDRS